MAVEQPRPPQSLPEWMGVEILRSAEGTAVARLRPRPEAHNYRGVIAGGALATLADVVMAVAANSALHSGRWSITTGLELHYLRPGVGVMEARARAVHAGRSRVVVESDITNEDGKTVLHATGTFAVVEPSEADLAAPRLSARATSDDSGRSA